MNILFIIPYPHNIAPSQRFRFEQYIPFLEERGMRCVLSPFATKTLYQVLYKKGYLFTKITHTLYGFARRVRDVFRAWKYDVIFIHREAAPLGPPLFETLFRALGKKIIFDFDDSIYLSSPVSFNRALQCLKQPGKVAKIISLSNQVIVGNEYLAEYARQFNTCVKVFPSTVDTITHAPRSQSGESARPVCIGWCGSPTTTEHLRLLDTVFQELAQKYDVVFKVIGAVNYDLPGVKLTQKNWSRENEVADLQDIDIGVMPLPNEEWARGKCGMKALLYMACGIPTVCSPVGVNADIICDGENGMLAATRQEWIGRLSQLIENEEFRKKIGAAGRASVERSFSVQALREEYANILKKVVRSSHRQERPRRNIVYVITDLDVGGTPTVIKTILQYLNLERYRVTVVSLKARSHESVADDIMRRGVRVVFLNATERSVFASVHKLYLLVRDERPDILHTWLFHANVLGRLIGTLLNVPVVISSERTIDQRKSWARVLLDRITFGWAHRVVVNARAVQKTLEQREKVSPDMVSIIENGVDPVRFAPRDKSAGDVVRDEFGVAREAYLIGVIARLDPVKGHAYLIDAFEYMLADIPHARLMIVGDGSMRNNLLRRAGRNDLRNKVFFAGTRRDIPEILSALDLFVLPSVEEGAPGSVLEAMAMAKPIIATRVGGVPEMITNGRNGILIPPRRADLLARAMIDCSRADDLMHSMGKEARKTIEQRFTIADKVQQLAKEYERLIFIKSTNNQDTITK